MRRAPVIVAAAGVVLAAAAPASATPELRAPASEVRLVGVTVSHGVGFTRYQQEIGGIPVLGGDGVVTDGRGARGDLVIDHTRRALGTPGPAIVGRAPAVRAAEQAVGADVLRRASTAALAILPSGGRSRLVWRVTVARAAPFGSFEVLVDARTGNVVRTRDLLHRLTGSANVFDPNPVVAQGSGANLMDNGDVDTALLTSLRVPVTLQRLTDPSGCLIGQWVHAVTSTATEVCVADRNFSAITRQDPRFEAVMAYFHLDREQAYVQSLGFTNVMNRQLLIHARLTLPNDADNSFYDNQTKEITLGTGLVDDGEDADVMDHEYGHAIQDDQVPGFGPDLTEAGAMGEGFGDYIQGAMSATFGHPGEAAACLAEWDNSPFSNPQFSVSCLRRLDSPLTLSQLRSDPSCAADVHCVGQAWSAALWDARGRVGAATMDRIVLQSQFPLTPEATFAEASRALLAADRQLTGGANRAVLIDALARRELVDPERLDDTPPESVGLALPATVTGHVDATADPHDVFHIPLTAGHGLIVRMTAPTGDLDIRLLRPGTLTASDPGAIVAGSTNAGGNEQFAYVPAQSGDHYLDVSATSGGGTYTIETLVDTDGDARPDASDNCPTASNPGQEDRDGDHLGDACDPFPDDPANDADHDGRGANADNCPARANADQADWDGDGRGDACDRSSRALLDRATGGTRRVTLAGRLRPAALPATAFRVVVQRRVCTRRCAYRTVARTVGTKKANGRITVTVKGLRAGRYRVRAELHVAGYDAARSGWRAVRVRG